MCEIDFDESERCDLLADGPRTARFRHRCSACRGWIQSGERYRYLFMRTDEGPVEGKVCAACEPEMKAFEQAHHVWLDPHGFDHWLAQCIDDEPESRPRWEPVLAAMRERAKAAKAGG